MKEIAAQLSTIGAQLTTVVLNPKFAMGAGIFPAPSAIFGGKGPARLKIIGAQFIKPILDPEIEMGGGAGRRTLREGEERYTKEKTEGNEVTGSNS